MAIPWVPIMMAASTAVTVMGQRQNIKNIKANLAWKNYEKKLQYLHDRTKLAKKQAKLLSEQRARAGASGVQMTGSPLIVASADMKEYEEDLMWLEKGVYVKAMADNAEATSLIAAEQYKMGSTLINAGMGYAQHKHSIDMAKKYGVS